MCTCDMSVFFKHVHMGHVCLFETCAHVTCLSLWNMCTCDMSVSLKHGHMWHVCLFETCDMTCLSLWNMWHDMSVSLKHVKMCISWEHCVHVCLLGICAPVLLYVISFPTFFTCYVLLLCSVLSYLLRWNRQNQLILPHCLRRNPRCDFWFEFLVRPD